VKNCLGLRTNLKKGSLPALEKLYQENCGERFGATEEAFICIKRGPRMRILALSQKKNEASSERGEDRQAWLRLYQLILLARIHSPSPEGPGEKWGSSAHSDRGSHQGGRGKNKEFFPWMGMSKPRVESLSF